MVIHKETNIQSTVKDLSNKQYMHIKLCALIEFWTGLCWGHKTFITKPEPFLKASHVQPTKLYSLFQIIFIKTVATTFLCDFNTSPQTITENTQMLQNTLIWKNACLEP